MEWAEFHYVTSVTYKILNCPTTMVTDPKFMDLLHQGMTAIGKYLQ